MTQRMIKSGGSEPFKGLVRFVDPSGAVQIGPVGDDEG